MCPLLPKPHSKKIFIILQTGILFFLTGCSGLEKSEQDKLRDSNAKGEYVYRNHDEVALPLSQPPAIESGRPTLGRLAIQDN